MRKIRYVTSLFLFAWILIAFNGCFTVNLKSVLPQQTFYSLDNIELSPNCKNSASSIGLNVSVLSPYDGKEILVYNQKSEINVLEQYKWIDLPKNMIRNAFMKIGLNNCIQVEQNPPISQKLNTLRINVNDLYVIKENDENIGYVYLNYELNAFDSKRIKNGVVITSAKDSNPAKALQDALKEALNKIIVQISQ